MTASRFKTSLALIALFGFAYLSYDFATSSVDPSVGLSGTVHLEGKPLAQGIVRFVSLDPVDQWALDGVIKDGRYEIPEEYGLARARYYVEFSSIGPDELQRLLEAQARGETVEIKERVPARFFQGTEVQVDLRSGAVVQADFDLR